MKLSSNQVSSIIELMKKEDTIQKHEKEIKLKKEKKQEQSTQPTQSTQSTEEELKDNAPILDKKQEQQKQ